MFSKKSCTETKPMASAGNTAGSTFSVFSPDISITGDIVATAEIYFDGKIAGDISCPGLVQGCTSEITGGVTADTARLAGQVHGKINVRELIILETGRIYGDVHYETLTIEQGAHVDGRLTPRGAQMPQDFSEDGVESHLVLATSSE